MDKILTVSILGCGSRGRHAYGEVIVQMPEQFKIVSLCDCDENVLKMTGKEFQVPAENRFLKDDEFLKEKRSDILVIATLDRDHYRHGLRALELGYDILLEKPITSDKKECEDLLKMQKLHHNQVVVAHVLRYAPAFIKAKEILDSGAIGKLVNIQALEQVGYWHTAHSYVRGNWRSAEETAPMILAKCCHDLDLLKFYAGSKAKNVSSIGDLTHFTKGNAPEGATKRCSDCPHKDSCAYSAKKIYLDRFLEIGSPENEWPFNVVVKDLPVTSEKLAVQINGASPYGRCVFQCDNDVVSHQTTNILFENGVNASLTMMGFTHGMGRIYRFFGTEGELVLDEEHRVLIIGPFGKESTVISIDDLSEKGMNHGGGDLGMLKKLYSMVLGTADAETSLEDSLESHLMGIAAEESRLASGKLISIR